MSNIMLALKVKPSLALLGTDPFQGIVGYSLLTDNFKHSHGLCIAVSKVRHGSPATWLLSVIQYRINTQEDSLDSEHTVFKQGLPEGLPTEDKKGPPG